MNRNLVIGLTLVALREQILDIFILNLGVKSLT